MNNPKTVPERDRWKSQIGFILSMLGASVGLGGVWRFAALAYEGGGAAFMFAYLVAILSIGSPLLLLEIFIGHQNQGSAPLALAKCKKNLEWLGWMCVIFSIIGVASYYNVIVGWCIAYLKFAFTLEWGADPKNFFEQDFMQMNPDLFGSWSIVPTLLVFLMISIAINTFITYRGINAGLEKINKIFMPLLFFMFACLFFFSLTLDGAMSGLRTYFIVDLKALLNPKIWFDAYGQAFFSLGIFFGIMITYASYLPREANVIKAGLITAYSTAIFNIFSGAIVFCILGFMSKSQGVPIDQLVSKGFGLAFITYPEAINQVAKVISPSIATVLAIFFFLSLVLAGISTTVGFIQTAIASLQDKFGWSGKKTSIVLIFVALTGGSLFTNESAIHFIDVFDHYAGTYTLVFVGLFQCIFIGWMNNIDEMQRKANAISTIKLSSIWKYQIQYFGPALLSFLLIYSLITEFTTPYAGYDISKLMLVAVSWTVIVTAGSLFLHRWNSLRPPEMDQ